PQTVAPQRTETARPKLPATNNRGRYIATPNNDVKIQQGGDEMAQAKDMWIDFVLKGGESSGSHPTVPPPPAPANHREVPAAPVPSVSPAREPEKSSVTVRWTGKLRIVPNEDLSAEPLAAGQSIVHLVGAPVILQQKPSDPRQPATVTQCA